LFVAFAEGLQDCFQKLAEESLINAEDFEDILRRRLKLFARALVKEFKEKIAREEVSFISQHARKTARSIRELYFSSAPAAPTTEKTKLAQAQAQDEARDVSDEEVNDDNDEEPVEPPRRFAELMEMLSKSSAMQAMCQSFQNLVYRRSDPWRPCREIWARELRYAMPAMLTETPISLTDSDYSNWKNRIQILLEDYTGTNWVWHPWAPPQRRLTNGKVLIQWKCVSNPPM
jgi:hypothetical protein